MDARQSHSVVPEDVSVMEQDCLALLFASVVENVNSKIIFMKNVRVFYFRNYVPY